MQTRMGRDERGQSCRYLPDICSRDRDGARILNLRGRDTLKSKDNLHIVTLDLPKDNHVFLSKQLIKEYIYIYIYLSVCVCVFLSQASLEKFIKHLSRNYLMLML